MFPKCARKGGGLLCHPPRYCLWHPSSSSLAVHPRYCQCHQLYELLCTCCRVRCAVPQVVALAWLQQQGVVPLLPAHWGSGQGSSSAPWALSLGLYHYKLDPPSALKAAAATAAAAVAVPFAAPAVEGDVTKAPGEAEDAEGAAAATAEAVTGQGGDAAVAAAAEVTERGAKGSAKGGAWADGLAALLGPEDVAALALYVGRLASSAAA
jgi:hypothetical protein